MKGLVFDDAVVVLAPDRVPKWEARDKEALAQARALSEVTIELIEVFGLNASSWGRAVSPGEVFPRTITPEIGRVLTEDDEVDAPAWAGMHITSRP